MKRAMEQQITSLVVTQGPYTYMKSKFEKVGMYITANGVRNI